MRASRDLVVVVAVVTLFVSSTAAWYFNPIVEEKTREIVTISETPFIVLQSDFIYKGNNWVTLTLDIENSASTAQSTYIEVQALDSRGEIILDDEVELVQSSIASNIPPGGTYAESFEFKKNGLKTELDVFLIILWWDTAQGVFTSGGGTSIPPKALVAFRGGGYNGLDYPKYRFYDVAWSDTHQLIDPADQEVRIVRSAWSPEGSSTDNALIVLMTDMGYIDAYNYDGFSWDHDRLGRVWVTAPEDTVRPFDFAYERLSGDAVVVYKDNGTAASKDLVYRVWDGDGWTEPSYINDPAGRKEYYWVRLVSDPLTDQLAMIGVTGDGEANCWVWDGSSWGSHHRLSGSVTDTEFEAASIAWEYTSGDVLAAVAHGQYVRTAVYDGSWTNTGSFSLVLNPGRRTPEVNWVVLKPHNVGGSNRVMLMALDAGRKLYTRQWTGSGWAGLPELMDDKLQSADSRCFDGDWMPYGTSFVLFAGQFNTKQLSYKVWSPGGWSPSGSGSWSLFDGATKKQHWVQVRSNDEAEYPEMLVGVVDGSKNLIVTIWDGVDLREQVVVSTHSTLDFESFEMAFSFNP